MEARKKNLILILIVILFIIMLLPKKSYAIGQMFGDADKFLGLGQDVEDVIDEGSLKNTSEYIYKAFLAVAIVAALLVGVVIGIKYIYESAEGQAKLKEAFVPYVAGCLIVFSAFPIWKIVIDFGNEQGFIKETYSKEEARDMYLEAKGKYNSGETDLGVFLDNEVKGAWMYVVDYLYIGYRNCDILNQNRTTFVGYLYVEYLSRFKTKEYIQSEWNNYRDNGGKKEGAVILLEKLALN